MWDLKERGFLPTKDPIEYCITKNADLASLILVLENLSSTLPDLMQNNTARKEILLKLGIADDFNYEMIMEKRPDVERFMLIYSYLAHAYLFSDPCENKIPKQIAVPLVELSKALGRDPILSYPSYCLYNFRKKDLNKEINSDNIEGLQSLYSEEIENKFIAACIYLEQISFQFFSAPQWEWNPYKKIDLTFNADPLETLEKMYAVAETITEKPQFLFHRYENIVYEDCWDEPKSFDRLDLPISVTAFQVLLGLSKPSCRGCFVPQHWYFINELEKCSKSFLFTDESKLQSCRDLLERILSRFTTSNSDTNIVCRNSNP